MASVEQIELRASGSLKTFGLLVVLLLPGMSVVAMGLSRGPALWIIFGAAIAQAVIIGRSYMRLRPEDVLIFSLALLPVALVIIFVFVIAPDVGGPR